MNPKAIAKRIVDLGIAPTNIIFADEMQAQVTTGILIRSPLTGIPIDPELPNYFRGSIQVIVRSPKHELGETMSKALLDGLTIYNAPLLDENFKGMRIKRMVPKTLPIVYRRSDGNGKEWSINFDVVYTGIN